MDRLNSIIIVIIVIIIIYNCNTNDINEYFKTDNVVSTIDKRSYTVVNKFSNMHEAANVMAKLNNFIFKFLRFLKNKFIIKNMGNRREREFVKRLLKNYNPDVLFENNPKPGEETSFVINKGEKFGLCLRDKSTQKIHDINLLKFVIIHELTHIGTINYGHEYQFWSWMKFMLLQAQKSGMYKPVDYQNQHQSYCGMDVTFNPIYSSYDWKSSLAY